MDVEFEAKKIVKEKWMKFVNSSISQKYKTEMILCRSSKELCFYTFSDVLVSYCCFNNR